MVVQSTHKSRFCRAHLASLLRDAPSPAWGGAGRGMDRGRIHQEEED